MRNLLGCLLFVPILAQAQVTNYYDKNSNLFMQSQRVNNQVIYTDPMGRIVATQIAVATPVFIPPLTPNLAPPRGVLVSTELPLLPALPTLEIFK